MKKLFLGLFIALSCVFMSEAKQQWVTGFVYLEGTTAAVPFASVWLLDAITGETEYCAFSGMNGWYDLGRIETDRSYILKVTAPNFVTKTKKIKVNYVDIQGNSTYHIPLKEIAGATMLMPVAKYKPSEIAPNAKIIQDYYSHLPGISYSDGYFTDKRGDVVSVMFNGITLDPESYQAVSEQLFASYLAGVEYYDISNTDSPVYGNIVNFVLQGVNIRMAKISRVYPPDKSWDI